MAQKTVLLALLWLIACPARSQHAGSGGYETFYRTAEKLYASVQATDQTDSAALSLYRTVIRILARSSTNDPVLFDSYVKAGVLEMTRNEETASLSHFREAIMLAKICRCIPDSSLFKPYLYTGSIIYARFNFDSALLCYRLAEQIVRSSPGVGESERLYNKLGVLYYETGDYAKSILYFSKALSLIEAQPLPDRFFIVNYKNNIASALRKLRRYSEALNIYRSLLSFGINTNELLHNIGVCYLDGGHPLQAIRYLEQVPYNNQLKFNDLARASLDLGRYGDAGSYLRKALQVRRLQPARQKDRDYGITLKYQGDLLMAKQQPEQAIDSYQQALIQVDLSFSDTLPAHNPVSFYGLQSSFLLFDILHAKAKAFVQQFSGSRNSRELENAFAAYASALQLAGHVQRTYHTDDAKLFLEQNVSEACKEAVTTGIRLYELTQQRSFLERVFGFAEDNKASVLQTNLDGPELGGGSRLPARLLQQQNLLKVNISRLHVQINQSAGAYLLPPLQDSLRNQEVRLALLEDKLDEDPAYYRRKLNQQSIPVDSIRKKILGADEALISYYYCSNRLICFYLTRERFGYTSAVADKALFTDVFAWQQQLQEPAAADKVRMQELASALYKRLIEPVASFIASKKRWLIVPYNELSYVPFEALPTPADHRPLVYRYAISYHYSANFLSVQHGLENRYRALAMAPFASSGSAGKLAQLKHSAEEIEGLPGRMLVDRQATKQEFISFCRLYPVVHLATHAVVNDSLPMQSYIEFNGTASGNDATHRLYEQEIYNLHLDKALLVVLSACETGNGRLVKEEGIISLSRAFSYAGCKSVITSLWKADDAATAFIMKRAHIHLRKGMPKDRALQQAKIDYLESGEVDARYKTPAYWAHLVLIGNNAPIVSRPYLLYALYVCGVGALAAMVFLVIKSRRQKSARGLFV